MKKQQNPRDWTEEDQQFDARTQRREALIRRINAVMGWEYSKGPIYGTVRAVALCKAVPISLEKLEQVIERLEKQKGLSDRNSKGEANDPHSG